MEQAGHQPLIESDNDDEGDICRICRLGNEQDDPLFYPCRCSGRYASTLHVLACAFSTVPSLLAIRIRCIMFLPVADAFG